MLCTPGGEVIRRKDLFSPSISSLKEAFDVGYAVHRMEEEGARKRKIKSGVGHGKSGPLNPFKGKLNLNAMDDDDDDDDGDSDAVQQVPINVKKSNLTF